MKKFKLYGKKDNFEGILATIYVKDNKVVVESKDHVVKEILEKEINEAIKKWGGLFYFIHIEEPKDLAAQIFREPKIEIIKIDNKDFIKAIASFILDQRDEYTINLKEELKRIGYETTYSKSRIIEE